MTPLDYVNALGDWVLSNVSSLIYSLIAVVTGYVFYRIFSRQIARLRSERKLDQHFAYTLNRVGKWIVGLTVFSAVLGQFGVTLGMISGLLAVVGGTIIGFAAINTIGNALAGLIVMSSRPFKVGDRIFFNGQFADVTAIELIYTKMVTLDNVLVSVPNQELLKGEIDNFGSDRTIRRQIKVTPGFECDAKEVEAALLEAAESSLGILRQPKPYVWITSFQDYAVEYALNVFISDAKGLPKIEAELRRAVLESCRAHKIDISTPLLVKRIQEATG